MIGLSHPFSMHDIVQIWLDLGLSEQSLLLVLSCMIMWLRQPEFPISLSDPSQISDPVLLSLPRRGGQGSAHPLPRG